MKPLNNKPLSGGNKDGIGISPSVKESSTAKNTKDPIASVVGKKPDDRKPAKNR